jgi:hypothetical protein
MVALTRTLVGRCHPVKVFNFHRFGVYWTLSFCISMIWREEEMSDETRGECQFGFIET